MVVTILAALSSLLFGETWQKEAIAASLPFWIFCGIGSSAVAFTLQMVAQKYLHPVTATLLMSLESVFAVIGGWIFLREMLSSKELTGCAVIFAGVIVSQLPSVNFKPKGKLCPESRL
jgi:drug/metabolite transporter (DMT)-like permease